ncbi:MAG TPA: hypothetical protein VKM93_23550 [Terriglobia bacterium]|nr:hypothetical protein [Terriglobia bacterium]
MLRCTTQERFPLRRKTAPVTEARVFGLLLGQAELGAIQEDHGWLTGVEERGLTLLALVLKTPSTFARAGWVDASSFDASSGFDPNRPLGGWNRDGPV